LLKISFILIHISSHKLTSFNNKS